MEIHEGFAEIEIGNNLIGKGPGKAGTGFYNSSQKLNRDLTVLLVKRLKPKHYLDAFGGTGIRGIRIALETGTETFISEKMKSSCDLIRSNVKINSAPIRTYNGDFSTVIKELDFDFIDVDPYGSAVPYIDDAINYLRKPGYIGITATDLSALTGSSPRVTMRKYGAKLTTDYYQHETGIRTLISYIARRAAAYDCWIEVVMSIWKSHYYRIVVMVRTGAKEADRTIKKIGSLDKSTVSLNSTGQEGPVWLSNLEDPTIISSLKVPQYLENKELTTLIDLIAHEDEMVLFYDSRDIFAHSESLMAIGDIFDKIQKNLAKNVYPTHFSHTGFKVSARLQEVIQALS